MLISMTGFGRAEISLSKSGRAIVEVHSLNHKFLDVECRFPEGLQSFEEPVRAMVAQAVHRGRVKVSLVLKLREPELPVVFRKEMARRYVGQLRKFQRQLGIPGEISLETILGLPQVMAAPQRETLPEQGRLPLKTGMVQAISKMKKMRLREGRHLELVMGRLVNQLGALRKKTGRRVPQATRRLEKKLAARIRTLAPSADSKTAAAEAAVLVQATDVSEELARIDSHLAHLRQAVGGRVENPGRTIDFLAQELQREVNTLGAKMRDGSVVRWVIAMKGLIEKLREQAANVE